MLKNSVLLLCILMIVSCDQRRRKDTNPVTITDTDTKQHIAAPGSAPVKKNSLMIVPGESIGEVNLGDDASMLTQKLGKPDLSDAAMGKAWITWYGKKRDKYNNLPELNVFTTYKDSGMKQVTVQLIRTTSAGFSTANGIRVFDSFTDIQKAFPRLQQRGMFTQKNTHRTMSIYDAEADGIAFDIVSAGAQQICIGIIVHSPGKNVMGDYLGFLFSRGWEQPKG